MFKIKNIKNTNPWTYEIADMNGNKILGSFYEKEFLETNPIKNGNNVIEE